MFTLCTFGDWILPIRAVSRGNASDPTLGDDERNVLGVGPALGRRNHRAIMRPSPTSGPGAPRAWIATPTSVSESRRGSPLPLRRAFEVLLTGGTRFGRLC